MAIISILEYLATFAIVVALGAWIIEIPERKQAQATQRKAKIFQAWLVINAAQGKAESGGRHHALRDLIDERESIAYADLSHANLMRADLSGGDLRATNLSGAVLRKANLSGAMLFLADLSGADLSGGDLSESNLSAANLSGANLSEANFSGAKIISADLSGAMLTGADLRGANLRATNLSGAEINELKHWRQVRSIRLANVWDVKCAPRGFLEWAIGERHAVSVENDDEWKAMRVDPALYIAWKTKWGEEHVTE